MTEKLGKSLKESERLKPLISVIVPVYRAEKYLADCIESILRQSISDIELLLIDDGSPDCSGTMCDTYCQKDTRIHVIHKENGGVSSARNMGLDHARGTYIVFVDSDDYLGENYLQALCAVQQASDGQKTFTIADYQPFSSEGLASRDFSSAFTVSLSGEKNDAEAFKTLVFNFIIFPPYCKLYQREIIEKNGLRFNQELRSAEDFDFNCRYIRYIEQIVYTPSVQYYYRADYKKYRPSNDGILGKSEILSAHIMAHGISEIAERMGVVQEVMPEIYRWAANKHYFNRLEMLFVPNSRVGFWTRKRLYDELISDELYYAFARKGVQALPKSTTKRIASKADCFFVWWAFYQARQLCAIQNKFQQTGV